MFVLVLGVPVGNVLLLLVQSSRLMDAVSIYMVIAILGIELVVALPCLLIYTGNQVPKTDKKYVFIPAGWGNLPANQLF